VAPADSRDFFHDPGTPEPAYIPDLVPPIDTRAMEILARPLPKLVQDNEPVVMLASLATNPAEPAVEIAPLSTEPRPWESADLTKGGRSRRTVKVTSQPVGASNYSGDDLQALCHTPCDLQVTPGSYTLRLNAPGYQEESRPIKVATSGTDVDVVLKMARGRVIVEGSAPVTVNGSPVPAQTPVEISLAPGLYRICDRMVMIKPNARLRLQLTSGMR
jgi:hypothetical protein